MLSYHIDKTVYRSLLLSFLDFLMRNSSLTVFLPLRIAWKGLTGNANYSGLVSANDLRIPTFYFRWFLMVSFQANLMRSSIVLSPTFQSAIPGPTSREN